MPTYMIEFRIKIDEEFIIQGENEEEVIDKAWKLVKESFPTSASIELQRCKEITKSNTGT